MILFFDSHPVQYKAPVYQRLQQLKPGSFKVVYATDSSVRGRHDPEFGKTIAWDLPLLEGYSHLVLNNERGEPLTGFRSLTGRGVRRLLQGEKPSAAVISQFIYEFDLATYFSCLALGIPIWIRQETQDEAFTRPRWKSALRSLIYRAAYRGVRHAISFGALNREHLLRHGIEAKNLSFAPYCSPVGVIADSTVKQKIRDEVRARFSIGPDDILLLFAGKLIDKKNPHLILAAMMGLSRDDRDRYKLLLVGSGPLHDSLRVKAAQIPGQVRFAGFVNQSEIPSYYLAADILILPSRRAGETWGLVVNEALQAGCAVIMTDAVGCHPEFGGWERVRVIPDGDSCACRQAMRQLATFPRSFDWCARLMEAYSVEAAARAIAAQMEILETKPE